MRSAVYDILPQPVRRSLSKFGADLSLARRQRRLMVAMMAERLGVSKATYARMEKGDPSVSMGAYAQALFVLGFGAPFGELIDQRSDEQGLMIAQEQIPRRIRMRRPDALP
jgi:transcriptional regulator with XRE-family HTH domain